MPSELHAAENMVLLLPHFYAADAITMLLCPSDAAVAHMGGHFFCESGAAPKCIL